MECYSRRSRRGRHRSQASNQQNVPMHFVQRSQTCNVFSSCCSFLLLAGLISIIYLMLDYHCKICSRKCDVENITRSISDIGRNISRLKESYADLEKSITKFSAGIPKIEGQIEILETLAKSMEKGEFVWSPKKDFILPNLGVVQSRFLIPERPNVKRNVTDKIIQLKKTPIL